VTSAPISVRKNQEIELTVERLALGGKGIGHYQGLVVFVDGALPGDRVRARVTRRRSRHAEARTVKRLASGGERAEPPCRHFRAGDCGGCRFQDLPYEQQLAAKESQVRETLSHLGGFAEPLVAPIAACPDRFHYRNKMEFSFHPGPGGEPLLGLHRRYRYDQVFGLDECWICTPLTNRIVALTRQFARDFRWPAYHPVRHTGGVRFLVVRHLLNSDQAMINLVASEEEISGLDPWAEAVMASGPEVRSVVLNINATRANVALGDPVRQRVLRGSRHIEERLGGLVFEVSANTFLQTNSRQAEQLYQAVLEEVRLTGEERVLDVYCGAGTITLLLARQARQVLGMEMSEDAVREAGINAARNGISNASFLAGEARVSLREWNEPWIPDVVVVDPPRAGLHPRVVTALGGLRPGRLVYVSCNPASLARDLASFSQAGYMLERVRPFDLFPHTPHIECVATLVLDPMRAPGENPVPEASAKEVPNRSQ
jgi:23S rRNA (uracil1939-C5)-methyltransferase